MTTPLVSAIVPVHNAARYLRETLDSLCNQTLREIEIICVENGSTDESAAILQEYAARDGRFRIITLPPVGAGAARNKGIDEARGKYVSLHDADDLFEPDMLEVFYQRAEQYGADVVTGLLDAFYDDGRIDRKENQLSRGALKGVDIRSFCPSRDVPGHVFNIMPPWSCGKLYSRAFLNEHSIRYLTIRRGEDVPFVYLSLYHARVVSVVDRVFTHYRQHSNSLSHNLESEPYAFVEAYRYLHRQLSARRASKEIINSLYREFLGCLWWQPSVMTEAAAREYCVSILPAIEAEFQVLGHLRGDKEPAAAVPMAFFKRFTAPEGRVIVQVTNDGGGLENCLRSLERFPVEIWLEYGAEAAGKVENACPYWANGTAPAPEAPGMPCGTISSRHFVPPPFPLASLLKSGRPGECVDLDTMTPRYAKGGLFWESTVSKQSCKILGVPVLTRVWADGNQRWFVLGKHIGR